MEATAEKKEIDTLAIDKIRVLNSLLSTVVPVDDQGTFGEYTKYKSAFSEGQRTIITLKIMQLVKTL